MTSRRKTEGLGEKPAAVPLRPQLITPEVSRDWSRISSVDRC